MYMQVQQSGMIPSIPGYLAYLTVYVQRGMWVFIMQVGCNWGGSQVARDTQYIRQCMCRQMGIQVCIYRQEHLGKIQRNLGHFVYLTVYALNMHNYVYRDNLGDPKYFRQRMCTNVDQHVGMLMQVIEEDLDTQCIRHCMQMGRWTQLGKIISAAFMEPANNGLYDLSGFLCSR